MLNKVTAYTGTDAEPNIESAREPRENLGARAGGRTIADVR